MAVFKLLAAGSGDANNIKASGGWVDAVFLFNAATTIRYVKLYDKATAPASTDVPFFTFGLPASGVVQGPFPNNADAGFGKGLGVRITTGQADNDNSGATAGDVVVNIVYR